MSSATLPARLKSAVDARGLSIRGLAKATGKSTGAVWAWLAGKYLPAADTIEKLAVALGVTPAWLGFGHECDGVLEDKQHSPVSGAPLQDTAAKPR